MSLVSGLGVSLNPNLLSGLNARGGVTLLSYLNFSTPVNQSLPETAAELASRLGDATCTPSSIFTCQEISGDLADSVGSQVLEDTGVTPVLRDRVAVGIDDGSGYIGRKCQEFQEGVNQKFTADNTTFMDVGTDNSVAVLVVFRMQVGATTRQILTKRAGGAGWYLRAEGGNGRLTGFVFDGVGAPSAGSTENLADGAWHYAVIKIDRTAETLTAFDDKGTSSATDISAAGTLSNAAAFSVGRGSFETSGFQLAYLTTFEGAAAEALTKAKCDVWWKHASDPTGLLTTQTRASLISVPVAAGYVGHFANNTLPIGYHSAFSDTDKLGLYCNSAVTNLVTYSELSTGAASSNVTATDNAADAPDGFRSATTILATADNGYLAKTCVTVAETAYCGSVWIEESTVGVTGRVILYDESNSAELASQVFAGTSTPQRIKVTATTAVGGISTSLRVEVDTDTETAIAWGWQVNLGVGAGAYVRTNGAAASLALPVYFVNDGITMSQARVEADFISTRFSNSAGNHTVFVASATGTVAGWRATYISSADHKNQARDEDSVIWAAVLDGSPALDTLYQYVVRWDVDAGDFPENATMTHSFHVDGVKLGANETDTTTVTDELTRLYVGAVAAVGGLDGFIQSIKVYAKPGAEPS